MATAEFSKLAGILSAELSQHHLLGFDRGFTEAGNTGGRRIYARVHEFYFGHVEFEVLYDSPVS